MTFLRHICHWFSCTKAFINSFLLVEEMTRENNNLILFLISDSSNANKEENLFLTPNDNQQQVIAFTMICNTFFHSPAS